MPTKHASVSGPLSSLYASIEQTYQQEGALIAMTQCAYWRQQHPQDLGLIKLELQYAYELKDWHAVLFLLTECEQIQPSVVNEPFYRSLFQSAQQSLSAFTTDLSAVGGETEDFTLISDVVDGTHADSLTLPSSPLVPETEDYGALTDHDPPHWDDDKTAASTPVIRSHHGFLDAKLLSDAGQTYPLQAPEYLKDIGLSKDVTIVGRDVLSTDLTVPLQQMNSDAIALEETSWLEQQEKTDQPVAYPMRVEPLLPLQEQAFQGGLATMLGDEGEDNVLKILQIAPRRFIMLLSLSTVLSYALMFFFILPQSWEKRVVLKLDREIEQAHQMAMQADKDSIRAAIDILQNTHNLVKAPQFHRLVRSLIPRDRLPERLSYAQDTANWLMTLLVLFHDPHLKVHFSADEASLPQTHLAIRMQELYQCRRKRDEEEAIHCLRNLEAELLKLKPALSFYAQYWALRAYISLGLGDNVAYDLHMQRAKKCWDYDAMKKLLNQGK